MKSVDELLFEAQSTPQVGFDFSFLDGRVDDVGPSWNYLAIVRERLQYPLLDMETGGGEVLSRLAPFAGLAVATEPWPPNVPVARNRLTRLGVHVVQVQAAPEDAPSKGAPLPLADDSFALVINRHGSYSPSEVRRVLKRGGRFVTQQVGPENNRELRLHFGLEIDRNGISAHALADRLAEVGLVPVDVREDFPRKVFRDVGAVAWYMKAISWEFPDFSIDGSREFLAGIDTRIRREGGYEVHDHRQLVEAVAS
jgi:SAM-dependent methyltransferase